MISGGLGGFHYSSIGSIVEVVILGVVEKVIVLILGEAEVNIVLVNNTSRDGGVLKFVLVIQAILEYQSISGCHLTQPEIGQKLVFVIFDKMRAVFVRLQNCGR